MAKVKQVTLVEPSKEERQALNARWTAKVEIGKGRGNGHGPCWKWTGAQSKTRNGVRGIIRVGQSSMSAVRVGKALNDGLKLTSEQVRRAPITHRGNVAQGFDECINPKHNVWDERDNGPRRAKGDRRVTRKK